MKKLLTRIRRAVRIQYAKFSAEELQKIEEPFPATDQVFPKNVPDFRECFHELLDNLSEQGISMSMVCLASTDSPSLTEFYLLGTAEISVFGTRFIITVPKTLYAHAGSIFLTHLLKEATKFSNPPLPPTDETLRNCYCGSDRRSGGDPLKPKEFPRPPDDICSCNRQFSGDPLKPKEFPKPPDPESCKYYPYPRHVNCRGCVFEKRCTEPSTILARARFRLCDE